MGSDDTINFVGRAPLESLETVVWNHGAPTRRRNSEPPVQIHWVDAHTVMLRQSKMLSYEAPFLYLFFGHDRAVLFDTGATRDPSAFPLRESVDGIVQTWLKRWRRNHFHLVVAHTHAHADHIAGDAQFRDRPDTVVVGHDAPSVYEFFGIRENQPAPWDLGGRRLTVFPIPGHHPTSIAVYDPWTGFLLTGDTLYPGRLYIDDFPAFIRSLERMVQFAESHAISRIMGCHIEMTQTPGRDYPIGSTYQPHEAALPMTVDDLRRAAEEARRLPDRAGVYVFPKFIIYHGMPKRAIAAQVIRLVARQACLKVFRR